VPKIGKDYKIKIVSKRRYLLGFFNGSAIIIVIYAASKTLS
jgi:hypothetical protein